MSVAIHFIFIYFQLEKKPEDYNEVDLKAIKDYEEKCRVLASERERYRKMLEIEYKKVENTIQVRICHTIDYVTTLLNRSLRLNYYQPI